MKLEQRRNGRKIDVEFRQPEELFVGLLLSYRYLVDRAQRKPRDEPNSEPEGKPEIINGSKNLSNADFEKTWDLTDNPEVTSENWPEPGPRWNEAYETWKWTWELHVYLFATVFFLIGLYAGFYVIANVYDGLQEKYLGVSLNIMVTFFGFTRAFVMFLDPYHQGNIIHNTAVMRVIWSLSGPCLTASDSLMILALIETANISIAPQKLQKPSVNAIIISFHFFLVITTDFVVGAYANAKVMLLFCQLFFVTWGCVLGTANLAVGYKLDKQFFSHTKRKERGDTVYIYLIYASGAANYFLCGIILYSAFGVFGVYSDVLYVDAWPWWTFQTLSRLSEAVACTLIFTVSAKRTRVKDSVSIIPDHKTSDVSVYHHESRRNSIESKTETISIFTALREIALIHTMNEVLPRSNTVSPMNKTTEAWTESSSSC